MIVEGGFTDEGMCGGEDDDGGGEGEYGDEGIKLYTNVTIR